MAEHTGTDRKWLKRGLPFSLGTTSYIIPDDILPNARYLADKVDDIQLVLFESDEISNMPGAATVAELGGIASDRDLTYTVHLPLDTRLGDPDERVRTASVGKCERVIDLMRGLDPFAWIIHLHGEQRGDTPSDDINAWLSRSRESVTRILGTGIESRRLCIETLDYPFELVADIVEGCDTSVCLDIGHLLLNKRDLMQHLAEYRTRSRVIHLHGVVDGVDHRSADKLGDELLGNLCRDFAADCQMERLVTLEVFNEDDLISSVEAIGRMDLCTP